VDNKRKRVTFSIGPLGMSLAAAAITAAAFAAISLADSGSKSGSGDKSTQTFEAPAPPGGGAGVFFRDNLSDADKQKMEDFRKCTEDKGAPAPPEPGDFDPSNPPKPPSAADREKLQKAFEACKDKLPEDMQNAGPPQLHAGGCAPPPGAPGTESGKKQNQDQSNDSSSGSSGSSS
jgi:hypothetical protein